MRTKEVSALALAIATCFPGGAVGFDADFKRPAEPASEQTADERETKPLPALGAAALIAAGVAAAVLASRGGGGGSASDPSGPPRTLSYTSAADFQTSEYNAQQGLRAVKAESLYYNGHYRWYVGDASDPAA